MFTACSILAYKWTVAEIGNSIMLIRLVQGIDISNIMIIFISKYYGMLKYRHTVYVAMSTAVVNSAAV